MPLEKRSFSQITFCVLKVERGYYSGGQDKKFIRTLQSRSLSGLDMAKNRHYKDAPFPGLSGSECVGLKQDAGADPVCSVKSEQQSGAVLICPFHFPKCVHVKIWMQLAPEHCNSSSIGVVFRPIFPAVKGINTLVRCTPLLTDSPHWTDTSCKMHQLNLEQRVWRNLEVDLKASKHKHLHYLRGHAAPEVGVGSSGLQHGGNNGLVLAHQLPQHSWIGEEVVTVNYLQVEEKDTTLTAKHTQSCVSQHTKDASCCH